MLFEHHLHIQHISHAKSVHPTIFFMVTKPTNTLTSSKKINFSEMLVAPSSLANLIRKHGGGGFHII